jgi:acetyl esterase/lipase
LFALADGVTAEVVDAGGVPAEWVDAPGQHQRVLVYLHGGGYVIGGVATHRELAGRLAVAAGARVLVLGYRLAPEHRFPAAVDDVVAAYRWVLSRPSPPEAVALVGDSAGGGLAMAAALALRDAGEPSPAAVVAFSPWVDLAATGDSLRTRADQDIVLSAQWLRECAAHYLGDADPRTPQASPLYAELAGLPPLLALVGTDEILYDDATRLVERAARAGTEATLEVFEDCFHLWMVFAPFAPEAAAAVERAGGFLRSHLV